MKVSAYTFVRNGVMLGYPFEESIKSALPLVDEYIVVVGQSEDDTLERVKAIDSHKIKVIETTWNEHQKTNASNSINYCLHPLFSEQQKESCDQ